MNSVGVFILNVKSYFNATWFLVLAMLYATGLRSEVCEKRSHSVMRHEYPAKLLQTTEISVGFYGDDIS
jgi:hypothetical protein